MIAEKRTSLFYLVAFIEGGSVMACELLGAKMIAPFYGTSLYVWTAVIGITLVGLASGYFLGGVVSAKYPFNKTLFITILVSSILMGIMPLTSKWIMHATMPLDIRAGVTISSFIFLLPPLVCFGMVSPIIIRLITDTVQKVGKFAGTVYAVSTVGGILATFLFGFWLIPFKGLIFGAILTAILLLSAALIVLVIPKKT